MPNTSRPNGFRPAKSLVGAPWTALVRRYVAADRSADTTGNHGDIYVGDPVKISAGKVLPANSGDTVLGVVVGVGVNPMFGEAGMFNPDNLMKQYLGHADSGYVWVVPAEGMLFEVQETSDLDLVEGSLADTNIAAATAHGSRTTSLSSAELTTAVNNDVRVVELQTAPDNDTTITKGRFLVKFQIILNSI